MAQPPANVNNYGYSPAAPTPPEQVQPNFAPQPPMAPIPSAPPPPNFAPQQQMAPAPAGPPPPMSPGAPPSPMAPPPNYNPSPYGQPNPYGQPPPAYTPSQTPPPQYTPSQTPPQYTPSQTPPTSPGWNRPIVRPIIAAPQNNFMCCEYMVWVQIVSVILLVCFGVTLLYFIGTFSRTKEVDKETDKCEKYKFMHEDAYEMSNDAHLICGAGIAGSFGWLIPVLLLNVFDVVNAFWLKKAIMFRLSAVLWSVVAIVAVIILLACSVTIFFVWTTFWRFFAIIMILCLLWIFLFPGIILIFIYAYTLFRTAKLLPEDVKPVNAAAATPNAATPNAATPSAAVPNVAVPNAVVPNAAPLA
ncbi:protein piccolo-like protein [Aphelenchoides avenae]|nr:protein piccolo-like protein [Aphelenchus avenae]